MLNASQILKPNTYHIGVWLFIAVHYLSITDQYL